MPFSQYELAPLDGAALWGYLEVARHLRLTTTVDGLLEVCPLWFVARDETLYLAIDPTVGDPGRSTTPAARLLPALEAGQPCAAVVDDGEDITTFRGVQIAGKAERVTRKPLVEELQDLALEKYFYIGHPHLEHYLSQGMLEERRWFRLVASRIAGWDRRYLPQPPIMERRLLPPALRKRRR